MKTICAWCHKELKDDHSTDTRISHGMCKECRDWMLSNRKGNFKEFLERLKAPVLVVDGDGIVKTANSSACKILGKNIPDISGFPGGNVVECIHSRLPEGCGNTIHCPACTIRGTITETYKTGKPCEHAVAHQTIYVDDKAVKKKISISTIKKDDIVLLRIDEIVPDAVEI